MNILKLSKMALAGLAILLTTSAFAANKGSMRVDTPVSVDGHKLLAGDYTVEWAGTGPSVELTILRGNKTVVVGPAKLLSLDNPSHNDSVIITTYSDGTERVSQILFSGKRYALEIRQETPGENVANNNH